MSNFELKPIGYFRSDYKEKFGTPRQSLLVPESHGIIELENWVQPKESLHGLEGMKHIWVLWVFHDSSSKDYKAKVSPPRLAGERVGVFASRSPHRPNPIGLSLVKLVEIKGNKLYVTGIDMIEGTPVVDIKPYMKGIEDSVVNQGGWVEKAPLQNLEVHWSPQALRDLEELPQGRHWQCLIEKTLRLDPRRVEDRKERGEFGFRIDQFNVRFRSLSSSDLEVLSVQWV